MTSAGFSFRERGESFVTCAKERVMKNNEIIGGEPRITKYRPTTRSAVLSVFPRNSALLHIDQSRVCSDWCASPTELTAVIASQCLSRENILSCVGSLPMHLPAMRKTRGSYLIQVFLVICPPSSNLQGTVRFRAVLQFSLNLLSQSQPPLSCICKAF
jgi:hypothetical protein